MYRPAKPIRLSTHNTGVRNNKKCACVVCTIQCYYILEYIPALRSEIYGLEVASYYDGWVWCVWVGGWGNSTDLHEESKGR